jgi:hypothetical protein
LALTAAHATVPCEYELRLPRRTLLQGRVVGKGSETGPEGLTVRFYQLPSNGGFGAKTTTRPNGDFSLEVTSGDGHVILDGKVPNYFVPDFRRADTPEDIKQFLLPVKVPVEGPHPPIRLEVPRGLIVRGTVRSTNGQPVPGATVRAIELGGSGRAVEARADANGQYEVAGLNPRERYQVHSVHQEQFASSSVPGLLSHRWTETREVELDLDLRATVTMRGRVLFHDRPVPNVRVQLNLGNSPNRDATMGYLPVDEAYTGADGQYALTGVRPGDLYRIELTTSFPAANPIWEHGSPFCPVVPEESVHEIVLPDVRLHPSKH